MASPQRMPATSFVFSAGFPANAMPCFLFSRLDFILLQQQLLRTTSATLELRGTISVLHCTCWSVPRTCLANYLTLHSHLQITAMNDTSQLMSRMRKAHLRGGAQASPTSHVW